jgi:hypothetical protein
MKFLTLVLAFLPLIVFSVLARFLPHGYIGVAGLAAAVIALIAILTSHPVWPPKILNTWSPTTATQPRLPPIPESRCTAHARHQRLLPSISTPGPTAHDPPMIPEIAGRDRDR